MRRLPAIVAAFCLTLTAPAFAQDMDVSSHAAVSSSTGYADEAAGQRPELFLPMTGTASTSPVAADDAGFTPMPDTAQATAPAPSDSTDSATAPAAPVIAAATPGCADRSSRCLKDQDNALRRQLEVKRLAELKGLRDGGNYSANRAKTRAFISMGMSDDARREVGCDRARKAAHDADQNGDSAWYACDVAGLQSALNGMGEDSSLRTAADIDTPAPLVTAPVEAVTAEATN